MGCCEHIYHHNNTDIVLCGLDIALCNIVFIANVILYSVGIALSYYLVFSISRDPDVEDSRTLIIGV